MLSFTDGALAAAGFVPAAGDAARNLGSALGAALYRGEGVRATVRLVVGVRLSRLERREHGTATGRCSVGHWVRIAEFPSPAAFNRRGWATLARRALAAMREAFPAAGGSFAGVVGYVRGDANRCRTRTGFNATEPTAGSGCGGKGTAFPHGLPGFSGVYGFVPASGRRVGTHCPGKIRAAVRRERQREASKEYRNTRGTRS